MLCFVNVSNLIQYNTILYCNYRQFTFI